MEKNCKKGGTITEENINKKPYKHVEWNLYFFGNWISGIPGKKSVLYIPEKYIFLGELYNGEITGEAEVKFFQENCIYKGNLDDGFASGSGVYEDVKNKFKFEG